MVDLRQQLTQPVGPLIDNMSTKTLKVTVNDVLIIIGRDFPSFDSKIIMDILNEYSSTEERFRVYSAALKLSEGHIDKLREWIERANIDFRDVLSPAEYPRFHEIGFCGIERLSKKEINKLKKDDWKQYRDWFNNRDDNALAQNIKRGEWSINSASKTILIIGVVFLIWKTTPFLIFKHKDFTASILLTFFIVHVVAFSIGLIPFYTGFLKNKKELGLIGLIITVFLGPSPLSFLCSFCFTISILIISSNNRLLTVRKISFFISTISSLIFGTMLFTLDKELLLASPLLYVLSLGLIITSILSFIIGFVLLLKE